jgi:AmmeMemoRadiSam system protein A
MLSNNLVVSLARDSLRYFLKQGQVMAIPQGLPEPLMERAGVFVSIKENGELRGCIGTIEPIRQNIAAEIIYNAISAGTEDPRFMPVELAGLPKLQFSVDILGTPEAIDGIEQLDPQHYGVIVCRGPRRGLLLPMLEGVNTAQEQVAIARQKAGIDQEEEVKLYRFTVTRYR